MTGRAARYFRGRRSLLVALLATLLLSVLCALPARVWADGGEQAQEDSAIDETAGFGLNGFVRYNRGAQRLVDDTDLGYRFPVAEGSTVVVINMPQSIWVHVDPDAAQAAGFEADDEDDVNALIALIKQLDETHSRGGVLLADEDKVWVVSTQDEVVDGSYRYIFRVQVGDGYYTSVQPAEVAQGSTPSETAAVSGLDLGEGALWVDNAQLVAAADVAMEAAPTWQDELASFFTGLDMRPFWVSLKTSAVALVVTFVLGLVAAWKTMGTSSRLKGLLDSVFTIPMVLPPTVCGFLLLLLFGQSTPVGRWLIEHGVALVFTWPAAVISAIVVSFPLMYRTALGAFEGLDAQMLDAARTLGWSEARIFRCLMLPLAWPSIAAGTVLAFARAMGEFGCTLFFAGNYAGETQTIPIAIYFQWMSGNTDVALFWVIVVILFSFLVILFINIYTARSQRYRARGISRAERRQMAASGKADALEEHGGDALRIDREALSELLLGGSSTDAASTEGRR
ncbi:molybdate ABC transporter permease subunit [Collinsella ihumii]|uniref:Molybdate ABC transporter permease subunit n=1 Tax=Collinsella ihumii TaxID=1720204 RepID=A0ABT7XH72_9ACTN|nr:molybdate ABC transporter permease subunit [Collinsella ihumii]MDN0064759.1 molybdate ABC transporter permease subunit [Collinsella ihumii]